MWRTELLIFYLIGLSIFDVKEKRVPMVTLVLGVAVVFAVVIYGIVSKQEWLQYIMGLVPGTILFFIAWTTKKIGYADGVVLAVVGVFEGFRNCILILTASLLALSVCSGVLLFLKRVRKDSMIPYIPFLCAGYVFWKVVEGI